VVRAAGELYDTFFHDEPGTTTSEWIRFVDKQPTEKDGVMTPNGPMIEVWYDDKPEPSDYSGQLATHDVQELLLATDTEATGGEMTTALERVREAIISGTSLSIDDVEELTSFLPIELQDGLWRLIAGVVATFHSNGGAGVEDWMGETMESHLQHALVHSESGYWCAYRNKFVKVSKLGERPTCEDELNHLDHAACRMAMAFAREGMVK
jgi:hypothetical protein